MKFETLTVDGMIILKCILQKYRSGIDQWYSAGLRTGCSVVRVPAGAGYFTLHHRVQTSSGAHSASFPMDTRGSFIRGKAAEA
jgi:hypothetical protein